MNKEFKTEKYDFFDFEQDGYFVRIGIRRIDEQGMTKEDENELEQFFKDMGKWESLMKTGINLIEDTGIVSISHTIREKYQEEFGAEKYNISIERGRAPFEHIVSAYLSLTREECLKRSRGKTTEIQLRLEEIVEQLRNIPKWRTLIKTVSQVGSVIR